MSFYSINSTGRITSRQAQDFSTYEAVGWQNTMWGMATYPYLLQDGFNSLPFPQINSTGRITEIEAKQQETYDRVGWDFSGVWGIDEGDSFPFFPLAPAHDFLLHVAISEAEIIDIIVMANKESSLKITMPDGTIGNIPLVEITDTNASPVRIATSKGIKSLKMLI